MIGTLKNGMEAMEFLNFVKLTFQCGTIRYTNPLKSTIERVAVCGGSGSFLLQDAIRAKADVFITGDFKYHEFFDAENHLMIADIGHFESEQYTSEWLVAQLKKKFTSFAVRLTSVNTNPINYL
jgi:putative NIF3 family GTP cyclohydrolase 1 type 2